MKSGIIFDLEGILLFPDDCKKEEDAFTYTYLLKRNYIFHPDDLEGNTPTAFAKAIITWKNNDAVILEEELRKIRRNNLLRANSNPEATGVLQVLSSSHKIIVLSKSQGDGIVKALANHGIRNFIDFIVPKEDWVGKEPKTLGLTLCQEKYREIPRENWSYICLPTSENQAKELNLTYYIYGKEPFYELEDIMEEFL